MIYLPHFVKFDKCYILNLHKEMSYTFLFVAKLHQMYTIHISSNVKLQRNFLSHSDTSIPLKKGNDNSIMYTIHIYIQNVK